MAAKTSPEIIAEITKLWKAGGWSLKALERKYGITRTTIKMFVDPDYADYRRQCINRNRRAKPPPSQLKRLKHTRPRRGPYKLAQVV